MMLIKEIKLNITLSQFTPNICNSKCIEIYGIIRGVQKPLSGQCFNAEVTSNGTFFVSSLNAEILSIRRYED